MTYVGTLSYKENGNVNQSEFLNDSFNWLSTRLSREKYVESLEEPVANLLEIFFSKSDEDRTKILNFFKEDFLGYITQHQDDITSPVMDVMNRNSDYSYQRVTKILKNIVYL